AFAIVTGVEALRQAAGKPERGIGTTTTQSGKLLCACDTDLILLFEDTLCRDVDVVVVRQSLADQLLQGWILEDFCPLLVSERTGFCVLLFQVFNRDNLTGTSLGFDLRCVCGTKDIGSIDSRPLIVGTDRTARDAESGDQYANDKIWVLH